MKTLCGFSVCNEGEVSLCEVDGRLHGMKAENANISIFTNVVDNYPKIHITRDVLHCIGSGDESRALFLPVHETFFKQVSKICYEQGFTEALRFMSRENHNTSETIKVLSRWTLRVIDVVSKIHNTFQPGKNPDRRHIIATFSETRNWQNSPIRCIAWHPHCTKLALAASDDSVRIYSIDSNLVPILKSKVQKNISQVAWRPCSASELAVSCETCILIWTVDPNSVVTRPSTANSFVLHRFNHCPVSSIAWSPHGECLVSASANDSRLLVWDVALDQTCPLKRAGSGGNSLISWSKNGTRLVAATGGFVFRVWECKHWYSDRWNIISGHVQSFAWSLCGNILLFVTSTEPILYCLSFAPNGDKSIFSEEPRGASSPQQATPLLDLSRTELENRGQLTGGLVQSIAWCPRGRYLGILFKETNYIVICMVQTEPVVQVTPSSLVSGQSGEYPCTIAFQNNFKEGSCLTIGWSTGRLQYFPLVYNDDKLDSTPDLYSSISTIFRNYNSY